MSTNNFITKYLEYATARTNAPEIFHKTASYTILSAITGRIPILLRPMETYPIYWGFLLGDSTETKKTTSINLAKEILESNPTIYRHLPNESSPEGYIKSLSEVFNPTSENKNKAVVWWKDELGQILSQGDKGYMAAFKHTMNDLHNSPLLFDRDLVGYKVVLEKPYFSVLAATQPANIEHYCTEYDYASGWLSKFHNVYSAPNPSRPLSFITEEDKQNKQWLEQRTFNIYQWLHTSRVKGFIFNQDALTTYSSWCKRIETYNAYSSNPEISSPYLGRSQEHGKKLSALAEIAKLTAQPTGEYINISKESVNEATAFIESTIKPFIDYIIPLIGSSEVQRFLLVIRKECRKAGCDRAKWSDILRSSHLDSPTATKYKQTLKETLQIEECKDGTNRYPTLYIKLKDHDSQIHTINPMISIPLS